MIVSETEARQANSYIAFEPHFNDKEYWCICFFNGRDLNNMVEKLAPIEEIRNGELHLLLNNSLEGMSNSIEYVHRLAEHLSIPKNKITFVTSAYDVSSSDIRCVIADTFEFTQSVRMSESSVREPSKKKFIYPNHRWRLHRPILVSLLASKDLLKHGHVSMRQADDNQSWDSCRTAMLEQMPELTAHSLPDLYIDEAEFSVGYPDELAKRFYMESAISIVSETNFYSGTSRFFSEKTYKNIDYEMPFILVSRPHSLSLLREKGYETFHPYINEDYDLEEDDNKRLVMIANEIERLCELPDEDMSELIEQLKPICARNREVLARKQYPHDFIWHTL